MKASLSRILLVLLSVAAITACNAAPLERRASSVVTSKIHKKQEPMDHILSLRGGGVLGTPVNKKNLATLYTLICSSVGILGMPAPEKFAEVFGFTLQEGTLGHLLFEVYGSTCVGLVVMSYLAANTSTSPTKISMYGSLPCFYTTFRNVLKGSFSKMGFMDYFGTVQLVIFAACIHGIQTGSWDATLAAKALTGFPLIMGVVGSVDPQLAEKLMGLPKQTGASNAICVWFFQGLLMWGVMSWSLLSGESALKSIGLASLVVTLAILDNTCVRKVNQALGFPVTFSYAYLASVGVIAAGLLLD